MEKRIRQLIIITFSLFFFAGVLSAQETILKRQLSDVLNYLETKHEIKFNYAQDQVMDIKVFMPDTIETILEVLEYLTKQTPLTFSLIGDKIVVVKQKEAYVFCGVVKDKKDHQPIINAIISNGDNMVLSGESGFFSLTVKNLEKPIAINCLGYKSSKIEPKSLVFNDCLDVFLDQDFYTLSEVVISNYLVSGINKINNGSFEIDFSNFKILPGLTETDVLHSIQALPGVNSTNETVSNINLRGGTHDQNLILWDNIKMYQSGHFFGLISMYNPQITQKVFLKKNGSDVSSTDGVSGTIDMQTDKEINTDFKGSIGLNFTNFNSFLDVPLGEKSSIQIAARKSVNDFFKTPTYTAFFDRISQNTELSTNTPTVINSNKTFDFYDTSFRWIYRINDKDQLQINFINVYNRLLFDENLINEQSTESRRSSLSQNSIAEGLSYNRIWNDKFKTVFEFYETDYKLKAINVNIEDDQRFLQKNSVSESSVKLKTFYNLNHSLQLLGGYHFVETEITNLDDVDNPLFRNLVSEVIRTHGIFTELGYRSSNKKIAFNFGLRYNYIGKFKKQILEPRFSFNKKLLDGLTLEILGELKHQNTSQVINFQSDFLGIEKRRWQLANNDNIPVIRSKQISVGINFSQKGWLFNADTYLKQVKGITSQSQGFQNQYEFVKTHGDYSVFGIDVLFRKHFNQFDTWLGYSFMDNNYRFKTLEREAFPSNYDIIHNISLGATYISNNLKIATGLNWHSGKPTTKPEEGNEIVNNEINFAKANEAVLKDYLRLDISAIYDFKLSNNMKLNAGLSVWNVMGRKNELNNFYRINEGAPVETLQNSLGFTPNAVLRVDF
ncbi:TonB-dependent receptor plug domain-containing protein [Aestuariivivens marinum]|uniref:TonB-dependent receptor plug domain-containing protein n=1 Tax=Aestuariivivens marinum TaxID=2913555 RepID=UPI001F56762B|nr:TonB-dependent receptor plug domain-containing protein [Aestuariivivens marinum]